MTTRRVSTRILASLLLMTVLVPGLGCGNDLPPNGSSVDLVDPVKAAEQTKSRAAYSKANPEVGGRGGRR